MPLDLVRSPEGRRRGSEHSFHHGDRALERRACQPGCRSGKPGSESPVLAVLRHWRHAEHVIGGQTENPGDPDQRLEVGFVRLVGVVAVTRLAEAETPRDLGVRQPQLTRSLF
jgi:hypothetical protein